VLFRSTQVPHDIEEAEEILSQMEVELTSLPPSEKTLCAPKVKSFKQEFKKLKDTANKAHERAQLLGPGIASDQRNRLLAGTERLQDGSRRLEEAKRVAMETEAIGVSTLEDLNRQREQILKARDTLQSADGWIVKSQGLLRDMHKRMNQNKVITAGIIFLLVALILVIIYWKW